MKHHKFEIEIQATPEVVWFVLWDDFHYRFWTNVFCEGSYMLTDWKEGGKVHFLSPNGNGMYSILEKNVPNKQMFFKHIGELKNRVEQELDEESKSWSGAREYYSLKAQDGKVLLEVELDLVEEHFEYFEKTFPKGLSKVKEMAEDFFIRVETTVNESPEKVWQFWTDPKHIMCWNTASEDWHTTKAKNELKVGGNFNYRMEAKDGSFGFDFEGTYTAVEPNKQIKYQALDGRFVNIQFEKVDGKTKITESFQAENQNPFDLQRDGWQAILNNFKAYLESHK